MLSERDTKNLDMKQFNPSIPPSLALDCHGFLLSKQLMWRE